MAITAGPFPGRLAEVGLSSVAWTSGVTVSGMTFNDIERVVNPKLPQSTKNADVSSNDSGGDEEHINTWRAGSLSFEFIAANDATYQAALWAYYLASSLVGWRTRPNAANSGDFQYFFAGSIESIEKAMMSSDGVRYACTIKRTGGIVRTVIP
jgi:hypothetical protein